jgi:DNA polymerase elongation subunit (family B)
VLNKDFIYDIETYPNCFTFTLTNGSDIQETLEISDRKNEIDRLRNCFKYLKENEARLVGFNNLNFDYPVVHSVLTSRRLPQTGSGIAKFAYEAAQYQIDSMKTTGFPRTIPDKDTLIPQIDLYRIWHFDNKAKATSLKAIEFNMLSDSIQDLPFPVGTLLSSEQIDMLIQYNLHDVLETYKFYKETLPGIKLREDLSTKYNMNFMNFNDTKIGKEYFIMKLNESGISTTRYENGRKVQNQTRRSEINLGNCLFDYYDFKTPEFNAIKSWFSKQKIKETKGVFSDIEEHNLRELKDFSVMTSRRQKIRDISEESLKELKDRRPDSWVNQEVLKAKVKGVNKISHWWNWRVQETLNVKLNDFVYYFGTGGIHGSLMNTEVKSCDYFCIKDADVASMYPNIAISNEVFPEHLSKEFCSIYEDVYRQRKSFAKGTPENAVLKLALNGVYGDSNNPFSAFYDPQYTMKVTINGQLSLLLLCEKLRAIPELQIIQVNTDGVTVKFPRKYTGTYDSICKKWENQVKLSLEFQDYSSMYIRDVNNYIAVYTSGKVKLKGAYQYNRKELEWHKNHSALVIPFAVVKYHLENKDIRETIKEHFTNPDNKYDFMLKAKVPRSSRLVFQNSDGTHELLQNTIRCYPSKNGKKLLKIMPPLPQTGKTEERILSLEKDWKLKQCNNINEYDSDVDLEYYFKEAQKLIVGESCIELDSFEKSQDEFSD